jgi:hypothetical protein
MDVRIVTILVGVAPSPFKTDWTRVGISQFLEELSAT